MKKKLEYKPIKDRVLILPDKIDGKTKSGIIIPETAKKEPAMGEIVAVGSRVEELKVGDYVVWGEFARKALVELDSGSYYYMKEEEVILVKEKK